MVWQTAGKITAWKSALSLTSKLQTEESDLQFLPFLQNMGILSCWPQENNSLRGALPFFATRSRPLRRNTKVFPPPLNLQPVVSQNSPADNCAVSLSAFLCAIHEATKAGLQLKDSWLLMAISGRLFCLSKAVLL